MTQLNVRLEKVFLCLRPGFFPEHEKEHITLKYYTGIRWQELMHTAKKLDDMLPATIIPKEFHTWYANRNKYKGVLVTAPDSLILDHLRMPHITLPDEVYETRRQIGNQMDIEGARVVDTLWLGRKGPDGEYIWAPYSTQGFDYDGEARTYPPIP